MKLVRLLPRANTELAARPGNVYFEHVICRFVPAKLLSKFFFNQGEWDLQQFLLAGSGPALHWDAVRPRTVTHCTDPAAPPPSPTAPVT